MTTQNHPAPTIEPGLNHFNGLTAAGATNFLLTLKTATGRHIPSRVIKTIVEQRPYSLINDVGALSGVGNTFLKTIETALQTIIVGGVTESTTEPTTEQTEQVVEITDTPMVSSSNESTTPQFLFNPPLAESRECTSIEGVINLYQAQTEQDLSKVETIVLEHQLENAFQDGDTFDYNDARFAKIAGKYGTSYKCMLGTPGNKIFNSVDAAVAAYFGTTLPLKHPYHTHVRDSIKRTFVTGDHHETNGGVQFDLYSLGRVGLTGTPTINVDLLTQQQAIYTVVPSNTSTGLSPKVLLDLLKKLRVNHPRRRQSRDTRPDLNQCLQIFVGVDCVTIGTQINGLEVTHTIKTQHTMPPGLYAVPFESIETLKGSTAPGIEFVKHLDGIVIGENTINFTQSLVANSTEVILSTEEWSRIIYQVAPFIAGKTEERDYLKALWLDFTEAPHYAVGLDGFRLASLEIHPTIISALQEPKRIKIPGVLVKAITANVVDWDSVAEVKFYQNDLVSQLVVHYKNGPIITITHKSGQLDPYLPDWKALLPAARTILAQTPVLELQNQLQAIMGSKKRTQLIPVAVHFENSKISLTEDTAPENTPEARARRAQFKRSTRNFVTLKGEYLTQALDMLSMDREATARVLVNDTLLVLTSDKVPGLTLIIMGLSY